MASLELNTEVWDETYSWPEHGDEWSEPFGNTDALWWFVLYPRLHRFVPAGTILEIAPGHGRWTQYLRHLCRSLVIVDLSKNCIDSCKQRFRDASNISYVVNDGRSLEQVPDGSVDFLFSFDSLVHCERDVIADYVKEMARTLKPDGVGFVHHSNINAYSRRLKLYDRLPRRLKLRDIYRRLASINALAWRARSMSAAVFRELCNEAGLECISQELISWREGRAMIDAISVFTPRGSKWCDRGELLANSGFAKSSGHIKALAKLYT